MKIKLTNRETGQESIVDSEAIYSIVIDGRKYNGSKFGSDVFSQDKTEVQYYEFVNEVALTVSDHLNKIKELIG